MPTTWLSILSSSSQAVQPRDRLFVAPAGLRLSILSSSSQAVQRRLGYALDSVEPRFQSSRRRVKRCNPRRAFGSAMPAATFNPLVVESSGATSWPMRSGAWGLRLSILSSSSQAVQLDAPRETKPALVYFQSSRRRVKRCNPVIHVDIATGRFTFNPLVVESSGATHEEDREALESLEAFNPLVVESSGATSTCSGTPTCRPCLSILSSSSQAVQQRCQA